MSLQVAIYLLGILDVCICSSLLSISKTNFPAHTRLFQRISSVIALAACVMALIASVQAGQRGGLIASHERSCTDFLASTVHSKENQQKTTRQGEQGYLSVLSTGTCCDDLVRQGNLSVCQCYHLGSIPYASYHGITCRYFFTSVKDYLILQSALLAVGSGVSLWFWAILQKLFLTPLIQTSCAYFANADGKMFSPSPTKTSVIESTIISPDGGSAELETSKVSVANATNSSDSRYTGVGDKTRHASLYNRRRQHPITPLLLSKTAVKEYPDISVAWN